MEVAKYLIHVEGIRCASCVQKLESLPGVLADVEACRVYMGESLIEVSARQSVNVQSIISGIKGLGFNAQVLENKAKSFELNKLSNRKNLSKIGVAGFCAGNIMLFSIPIYTGADGAYKAVFSYLSFIAFLPLLVYSSFDFYKNAWSSLKIKSLSIDLPITVALILGFIFSTVNLFTGQYDYLYYDSTASFIFLILSARYVLLRLQQSFASAYSSLELEPNQLIKLHGQESFKTKEELIKGDVIELNKGQMLPVKSDLISSVADWNVSLMTGESMPQALHLGCSVRSGSVLISDRANLKVLETYKNSELFQIISKIDEVKTEKTKVISLSDKFAHVFIAVVFGVAVVFFLLYSSISIFEAFQRSLALLIVACPCALALGTPLAYLMGIYKAKKQGVLVFKKDIFDRLFKIKSIYFDKTGTLTEGVLSVRYLFPEDPILINIILNLEKNSSHPVAIAMRKKYSKIFSDLRINPEEIVGTGVKGEISGDVYEFGKESNQTSIRSVLKKNGEKILDVEFSDQVIQGVRSSIDSLKNRGFDITLITGDNVSVAQKIAHEVGISKILSEQTPLLKQEMIAKDSHVMMVGDGMNDVLALQKADVSVAVFGSVQKAADYCDAYLLKKGVSQICQLFSIARNVRSALISNIALSVLYNVIAGTLAMMGYINPLVAALLMPLSSAAILVNTWRYSR